MVNDKIQNNIFFNRNHFGIICSTVFIWRWIYCPYYL